MIKAEVKMVGTVKRSAAMRTDKDNNPYLSFVMTVSITDAKSKSSKDMDVLVSMTKAKKNDAALYTEGRRVVAQGKLDIRKKGEEYAFYLTASQLSAKDVPEQDEVAGEMQFRGRLKNNDVIEVKEDRKGNYYFVFSAYSTEKVGDDFVSIWVRFIRFPAKGKDIDDIKPDWMQPKARVSVTGDLEISVYNNIFRFTCIVRSLEEYVKETF
jgi:hypothetical protein